jgi:hypothetical protein
METGCEKTGGVTKGHQWSGWPGAFCLRCGAGNVLETAVADSWLDFGEGQEEVWRSEDHKELVHLCDDFCYEDMTAEEKKEHSEKIRVLSEKLGV